ncbi:MAG: Hpt domain-containing protein [Pseudomonadota bacterium]|nr:Hpt domain-containing protein [Pseudomonadota bacterium]
MFNSNAGGPLAWVYPEIEVALDEVGRALEQLDWNDAASRILVLAHLHQVSGALHMVELPGPRRLAEELEQALTAAAGRPDATTTQACRAAIAALRSNLGARLEGQGVSDLAMLPALQALGAARGCEYHATELFHPDLATLPAGTPAPAAQTPTARRLRADYQRALLAALRSPGEEGRIEALAATLTAVAGQVPGCFGAARWQLLADVFAAIPAERSDAVAAVALRRLCTRADRQLRLNASADDIPNDALVREALFLASSFSEPGATLSARLCAARVPELLAAGPGRAADAVAAPDQAAWLAIAGTLGQAEQALEAWFRAQAADALPSRLDALLADAAQQFDARGEDAAMLLLQDARQALSGFPVAGQLTETHLEPVAECLAGLQLYAESMAAGDALAGVQLAALRERLRDLPGAGAHEPARNAPAEPLQLAQAIDESLLGVFLEEADALLRALHADAALLSAAELADGVVEHARASLQTLRGSGLVAGMLPLAQLCGELDHTLAAWLPRGEQPWALPAQLLEDAARELERWLARLAADRSLALPAAPLIERARSMRLQPALDLAPLISLQDIFLEEAGDRIEDLRTALGHVAGAVARPADALRAVHTLAGIARTAEHPGMAALARAMETLLEVLAGMHSAALASPAIERLHAAVAVLADMRADLVAGRPLQPAEELVRVLCRDADLLREQLAQAPAAEERASATVLPALDVEAIDHPDPDLLPIFREECAELLPQLDAALRAWSEGGSAERGARALKRGLHTLKGSARMSGLLRQGALAHRLEDLVLRWSEGGAEANAAAFEDIQAGLDHLALGIERLADPEASGQPHALPAPAATDLPHVLPPPEVTDQPLPALPPIAEAPRQPELAELAEMPEMPEMPEPAELTEPEPTPAAMPVAEASAVTGPASADQTNAAAAAPPAEAQAEAVSPLLRIRVEALDRMANAAGEAGIGRARLETEAGQLKRGLGDLSENIQRLKSQLREIEIHAERALPATLSDSGSSHGFDPLEMDRYSRLQELARTLAEGIDDVQTVHQGLRRGVDEVELALRQQGRVIRDLQQDLLRARMVPFASLAERLQRTTRQAARESGRELQFQLDGGQNEVDRSILERLAAPLEHLLRNAAVHGIETPEVRCDLGKPQQGRLTIQLTPGEHEVALRISDDGRGVDLARVRAQAEANGLLAAGQPCPDEELLQLIFRPGFSTARAVTSLAGRGVGLDVVRSEVISLGGRIHLDTRPGAGTDFTLVIPVTLATVQAVVVRAGDAWFAIPAPLVEQVRPVAREALADLYRERAAMWQGLRYPLTSLNRVLGLGSGDPEPQGTQQLVFLRSGDRRCALRVDELAGAQEIVVKQVSPHLARVPGVSGASVLGNGRIVLILNPVPLAVGADGLIPEALLSAEPQPEAATVMVVDDSITVRRVTTRLLERAGFQVRLAKDGQDALDQLADFVPDAMLLDVEMPRMDGFELVTRLRADARTRDLPVVVITSRTAERHRNHADTLGVQGYLGKPYREEDLLALLGTLLHSSDRLPAQLRPPEAPAPQAAGGAVVLSLVR